MADPEHVAELLKGVKSWNLWRKNNLRTRPDLQWANLKGANLQGANLQEAYLQGASLQGAYLQGARLQGASLQGAYLQGARLQEAYLQGAKLQGANLQKAYLQEANLQKAKLQEANLQKAKLQKAYLQGANLQEAYLQGADLNQANIASLYARFVIVDGDTLIDTEEYDRDTDFSGVGLDSARIEESLKSALKRNIRQKYWERRYKKNWLLNIVRPFWWASDYGSSTTRILLIFIGLSLLFSILYLIPTPAPSIDGWPKFDINLPFVRGIDSYSTISPNGAEITIPLSFGQRIVRAIYFSVVTMTTLGFGDITPHPESLIGNILVMSQVLIGYILLGALITRLSILFQDVG